MADEYRVVSVAAEVLSSGGAGARVPTFAAEVLRSTADGPSSARVVTFAAEVLRSVGIASTGRRRMSLM